MKQTFGNILQVPPSVSFPAESSCTYSGFLLNRRFPLTPGLKLYKSLKAFSMKQVDFCFKIMCNRTAI